jgi:hypothetical protein
VIGGWIKLCIISDRHVVIKSSIAQFFPKLIGYHQYCLRHFMSNFKTKLKNVALKNMLHRMCTNSSKQDFDILYKELIELMMKSEHG